MNAHVPRGTAPGDWEMSNLNTAAWNRCWSPKVFRTAYRLENMLVQAGETLELGEKEIRELTDHRTTMHASRDLEKACAAIGADLTIALSVWTVSLRTEAIAS